MLGLHALGTTVVRGATTADSVKAALFAATATIGPATTAYGTTGEVTGTGYVAGGVAVTNAVAPAASGTTAIWTPSASYSFGTVTIATSFDTVLTYNSTQANRAICVNTFSPVTVAGGTFTISMPTNDAVNALVRLG